MKKIVLLIFCFAVVVLGMVFEPYLFTLASPNMNAIIISSGKKIHIIGLDSSFHEGDTVCISCNILLDGKEINTGWELSADPYYQDVTVPDIEVDILREGEVIREARVTTVYRLARVIKN